MNTKKGLTGIALLLIVLLTTGCVSQEEFDKVKSDLTTAQSQAETLQGDLASLKSDHAALNSERDALQNRYDVLKTDYDAAMGNLDAAQAQAKSLSSDMEAAQNQAELLQQKIVRAKVQAELLGSILFPVAGENGAAPTETDYFNLILRWQESVETTGDTILKEKFQALVDSGFAEGPMMEFLTYLLESMSRGLEVSGFGVGV
jgi:outer membrane murein-binding lipoprotein Lpp